MEANTLTLRKLTTPKSFSNAQEYYHHFVKLLTESILVQLSAYYMNTTRLLQALKFDESMVRKKRIGFYTECTMKSFNILNTTTYSLSIRNQEHHSFYSKCIYIFKDTILFFFILPSYKLMSGLCLQVSTLTLEF